jgi:hypothetical protein
MLSEVTPGLQQLNREAYPQSGMELGLCFSRGFRRRTIWIVNAHRGDGKRFVVRADEKLTAFWNSKRN